METIDILIVVILAAILGAAAWYIHRARKKGVKCIGCPNGANCPGKCSGNCGNCGCCGGDSETHGSIPSP